MKELYLKSEHTDSQYYREYLRILPDKYFVITEYLEDDSYFDIITYNQKYIPGNNTNKYTVNSTKSYFYSKLKQAYNTLFK